MSFGYSIGDAISLTKIAWTVVQNSRKACGEHDELTREVTSLHVVLKRLEHEVAKPESPINRSDDTCREEIEVIAGGCRRVLKILDQILEKYNALSESERSRRKLWQKIKFGNGQMGNLADLRTKIIYYTTAMSLFLNMMSIGSMGSVEKQLNDAGGDLKEIKDAVNSITAHLIAKDRSEGSVLTTYPDDDKAVWKEFRRELIEDGFSSSVIGEHKLLIEAYIKELGTRGLLDDPVPQTINGSSAGNNFVLGETRTLTALEDAGNTDPQQRRSTSAFSPLHREQYSITPASDGRLSTSDDVDEEAARKEQRQKREEWDWAEAETKRELQKKTHELIQSQELEEEAQEVQEMQKAVEPARKERRRERDQKAERRELQFAERLKELERRLKEEREGRILRRRGRRGRSGE